MANNLFVTYDLIKTKIYPAVYEAIKSLGVAVKVTESNWYVNSHYNSEQAAQIVHKAMDSDDKLIVVDATNNYAYWYNIPKAVENHLQDQWYK